MAPNKQDIEARVSGLEITTDMIVDSIKELTTEVKELKVELVARIGQLEKEIRELQTKLIAHEESFANKEHVHKLEVTIAKIQGDLNLYASRIVDIEKAYSRETQRLSEEIKDIKEAYQEIGEKLEEISEALTEIKSERKALKEEQRTNLTKAATVSAVVSSAVVVLTFLIEHLLK